LTNVKSYGIIKLSQRAIEKREQMLNTEVTAELEMCIDCEQDFPREEMSGKYFRMFKDEEVILWCNECRDSYDPTPYDQWEVTTPSEVYATDESEIWNGVENEHGRVF
jgi:hypothetical protein